MAESKVLELANMYEMKKKEEEELKEYFELRNQSMKQITLRIDELFAFHLDYLANRYDTNRHQLMVSLLDAAVNDLMKTAGITSEEIHNAFMKSKGIKKEN